MSIIASRAGQRSASGREFKLSQTGISSKAHEQLVAVVVLETQASEFGIVMFLDTLKLEMLSRSCWRKRLENIWQNFER